MDDDLDLLVCPHCRSELTFDDAGDLKLTNRVIDPSNINDSGLNVVHADGKSWLNDRYLASEPKSYRPPAVMMSITDTIASPNNVDPELTKANEVDLNKRNIKLSTNDKLNND